VPSELRARSPEEVEFVVQVGRKEGTSYDKVTGDGAYLYYHGEHVEHTGWMSVIDWRNREVIYHKKFGGGRKSTAGGVEKDLKAALRELCEK
jgi:hypothetical protein